MDFIKLVETELHELDTFIVEVRAVRKKSIRKGKVVGRKDCPPGYKLQGGTRCVRMQSKERLVRKRAGKRAARKSKSARRVSFKRSIKIRQRRKLKTKKF
jgi:hypothetical protein